MSHRDFANIAVGDTLIINSTGDRSLCKVAKVTKTQFAIESGARFMRSDGIQYGGLEYGWLWASIPNADDIANVKAEQRQKLATDHARRLRNQIETAMVEITRDRDNKGWALSIETANDHMRRALEALQNRLEDLP